MSVADFAAKYPEYIDAQRVGGMYEIVGTRVSNTAELIEDGEAVTEITELTGWGYDVFAVVDMGIRSIPIMARAKG